MMITKNPNHFTRILCLILTMVTYTSTEAEDIKTQVETLVKALGNPSVQKRAEAEEMLMALGPDALPFLPQSARLPEAKLRLNRVRVALERQNVADSLEAGIVTFSEKSVEVTRLVDQVAQQTQNVLEVKLPDNTKFFVPQSIAESADSALKMNFWAFLDSFCDQFHLAPQTILTPSGKKGLKLTPTMRTMPRFAGENPCVAYLKPFRLEPLKVTQSILLNNNVCSTLIQLELSWEPRITPVFAYLKLNEIKLHLDVPTEVPTIKTVKMPETEHEILIGQQEFRAVCELPIPGKLISSNTSDALTAYGIREMTLSGTLSAVACGEKKDFTFDNLATKLNRNFAPVTQRTAAVLVTLSNLRTEKEQTPDGKSVTHLVATLRYRYEEAHEALESHRTWIYENYATLRKSDGTEIASERCEMLRQTPNEIATDIYFTLETDVLKELGAYSLIFPRPSGIYAVELPFEIKHLPLP